MTYKTISLNINGSRAHLQIERPDALNALNSEVLRELDLAVTSLQEKTDVHVVILSGSGEKAFVAGADIKFMQGLSSAEAETFSKFGNAIFSKLERLPQVVIARVQGFALGGGLELALACDFIVASSKARFGLPEVSLGLIPGFGGTQRLARKIGYARAVEWVATADKYSADDAKAAGLANHVVPPEELETFTNALCDKISKNGPYAVRSAKRAMLMGAEAAMSTALEYEAALFGLRFATAEAKEGIGAFVEKRPAQFSKGS